MGKPNRQAKNWPEGPKICVLPLVPRESVRFVKCFQEAFYKTHTFSRDQWEDTNVNVGVQVSKVLNIINNITGFVSSSWTDWAVTLSLSRRDVNSSQMFLYGPTVLLWLAFHPELNKEFTKNSLLNHKTQFFVLINVSSAANLKNATPEKGNYLRTCCWCGAGDSPSQSACSTSRRPRAEAA